MKLSKPVDSHAIFGHGDLISRLADRLTHDVNDAHDIAQESWLAAIRTPPRHARSTRGWIAKVVRCQAAGHARARVRRDDVTRLSAEPQASADPLEDVARSCLFDRLHAAVSRLDHKYEDVIRLRFFDGLSHLDIARSLNIPIESARTRQRRALLALRRSFGEREARATDPRASSADPERSRPCQ